MDNQGIRRMNALIAALAPKTPVQILDVGANPLIEGEVSYRELLDHGHAKVIGFEPNPEALEALNSLKSDAETYLPHALGDGNFQTLHHFQAPGFNSIYAANAQSMTYLGFEQAMTETGSAEVKTHRLNNLRKVPKIDFLKIDVQGCENMILKYGRKKLEQACAVQTEVRMFPLYQGEPRYGALDAELATQGFEFLRFASLKHACLAQKYRTRFKRSEFAQAVDGDAFFVRDLRNVDAYSNEKLKKLAIIADAIIDSIDLTIFTLEALVERGIINASVIEAYFAEAPVSKLRG